MAVILGAIISACAIAIVGLFTLARRLIAKNDVLDAEVARRAQSEEELRASEERFSKAFRASPVAMAISKIDDGLLLDANEAWFAMWGSSREEATGKTAAGRGHWAEMSQRSVFLDQLRRDGRVRNFEASFFTAAGEAKTAVIGGEVIHLSGEPRLLIAFNDITEQKRVEKALKEREALYRSVITTTHDAFWINDLSGRLVEVNDNYVRRSGYSRDELLGMRVADLEVQETANDVATHIERIRTLGSEVFTSRHRTKTGEIWDVEVAISYSGVQGGRIFSSFRDITERKQAEKALRESEERFAKAFQASPAAMSISRIDDGLNMDVNDEWHAMTGYSRADAIGKTVMQLSAWTDLTQRAAFVEL
jgi:PAS domain S-box-containing protein